MPIAKLKSLLKRQLLNCGLTRRFLSAPQHQPRVLMYHRINDHPLSRGIHPDIFAQHLACLQRHFRLISFSEFSRGQFRATASKPPLLLSFDDGHADFFTHAWPRLHAYNIPAVLFVSTDFVDNQAWLWPDKLRYVLHQAGLNSAADWHQASDLLVDFTPPAREAFIVQLAQTHKVSLPDHPTAEFAALSWAQLQLMQDQGLQIECHTHSHAILAMLTPEQIHEELAVSQSILQNQLKRPIRAIAYPNGRRQDISPQVLAIAQQLGFTHGFLAHNTPADTPLTLSRIAASVDTDELIWRLLRNRPTPTSAS